MAPKKKNKIRIGIYYDGYYFYKVSNYYKFDHPRQARISISGLHEYVIHELTLKLNTEAAECMLAEAHYFRGRSPKIGNEKAILGEKFFEDTLTREGVNLHYLPLVRGAYNDPREKGIDVSLALEAYKKSSAGAIDILALIAGDGDYLPLVRELQTMPEKPVDVLLLSWDFTSSSGELTMASQDLLEEARYPVQMSSVIDDRLNMKNPLIQSLFDTRQAEPFPEMNPVVPEDVQPSSFSTLFSPQVFPPHSSLNASKRKVLTDEEMARERLSTILSLDGSGGWIKDAEYNNFYFFYTDVTNKKPHELTIGMTLQFHLKYDKVKTVQKDNGEPSYRAAGPIYAME